MRLKMKKKEVSRNRRNIAIAIIVLAIALTLIIISYGNPFRSTPDEVTITVAWNPGSTADDMVRAMLDVADTEIILQNITGAYGADGSNAVFRDTHEGTRLLSTSLTAFVTSQAMGFAESSHKDWEAWLCAFSPAVVVVASDTPYNDIDKLITDIRTNPGMIRCADGGHGTISYIAAELFSSRAVLEIDHISYSGSNPAITALFDGEAEFAILPSTFIINYLHSGELRALGAFSTTDLSLNDGNKKIIVPSITGLSERLDAVLPIGEYYGLFIPADTSEAQLNGLETMIKKATSSDKFMAFIQTSGLEPIIPDRNNSTKTIEIFSSTVNWTLYDAGFLPTNPELLGIPRE